MGLILVATGLSYAAVGSSPAAAQSVQSLASGAPSASAQNIIVTAKRNESIGTVISASAGVVGGVELSQRPILRQGELLEAVPGMIVTAHTSGGKANQYYLRASIWITAQTSPPAWMACPSTSAPTPTARAIWT